MFKVFTEIYEYLLTYCLGYPYEMKVDEKSKKMIDRLLSTIDFSVNDLWEYMVMVTAFQYDKKARMKYTLNMFTSYKMIDAWINRDATLMFRVSEFQVATGLKNPIIKNTVTLSDTYLESLRRKFYNTERGFIFCQKYGGILYGGEACNECLYKKECATYANQERN